MKRSQLTYARLLRKVDPRSRAPLEWKGTTLRPGSTILESALWPDGNYPLRPLLVEFAGAANPERGHNRHHSDETVILWFYDRALGKFVEAGRVVAPNKMWPLLLEPLVREEMAREFGAAQPPDLEGIRGRIVRVLAVELDTVADSDRARVLTLIHDELSGRIAEWGELGDRGVVPLAVV